MGNPDTEPKRKAQEPGALILNKRLNIPNVSVSKLDAIPLDVIISDKIRNGKREGIRVSLQNISDFETAVALPSEEKSKSAHNSTVIIR